MGDTDDWLERIAGIRQHVRRGERAPHKPLLLLYAMGRLQRTGSTKMTYVEAEPVLTELLRDFGPPGRKTSPAYPFHHLQTDGLWTVISPDGVDLGASSSRLRAGASGQFAPDFEDALRTDPRLLVLAARFLLDTNFPESLHADICNLVGLNLEAFEIQAVRERAASLRRRDPHFRDAVLVAYEYRCAMCGYDGRLGTEAVGLDAAHVRWWPSKARTRSTTPSAFARSITSSLIAASSGSVTIRPSTCQPGSSDAAAPPKCSFSTSSVGRCMNRSVDKPRLPSATSIGIVARCFRSSSYVRLTEQ